MVLYVHPQNEGQITLKEFKSAMRSLAVPRLHVIKEAVKTNLHQRIKSLREKIEEI